MPPRDFTDSEEEDDEELQLGPEEGRNEASSPPPPRASSPGDARPGSSSPPVPAPRPHGPIRITLRPSINHLVNESQGLDEPPSIPPSERSSLSPPPPIRLRMSLQPPKPPQAQQKRSHGAGRGSTTMDFSSSEDELALPPGKPRKSTGNSATASPSAEKKRKITLTHLAGGGVPRKSYDWLAPSEAGASHHGPPSREAREEGKASPLLGWSPEDPDGLLGGDGVDGKGRKSHKRRKADNPGPGKAWRKGLKKGMPIPWRGGEVFLDETQGGPGSVGSDDHRRSSLAGSPEAPSETATAAPVVVAAPRAPSPTFVLADAATLGFPVFPKPIVPPKISLSAFPRVTQTFAPNNGGDAVFPRKERVRTWKETERVLVGIGGGHLTFKSWAKGPASELGRLIQADKEAKDLHRAKLKAQAAAQAAQAAEQSQANATPLLSQTASPNLGNGWERPPLTQATSFDSTMDPLTLGGGEARDDLASEIGDAESVAGSVATLTPEAKPKRSRAGGPKKPRKSKLAQEIVPSHSPSLADFPI